MRGTLLLLLALAASIGVMLKIREDSGYVLLSYGDYSVETSLVVLLLAVVLLFVAGYLLVRSAIATIRLPKTSSRFLKRRARTRAANELQQGLLQLAEGNWQQAQKQLTKHATDSQSALVHYLSAARAAQLAHDTEARDAWLSKAHQNNPEAELSIGLAKAELQVQANQTVQALATLRRLRENAPRHPYVLKLLATTHSQLGEWQELEQLLSDIEKYKAFDKAALAELKAELWEQRLAQITQIALSGRKEIAAEHIQALWQKTARAEREDTNHALQFAKAWHATGNDELASKLIAPILKAEWHEEAATLYGWLSLPEKESLKLIETWLKQYGERPALLLTAARVCIRHQLWGRARNWLNHLCTTQPSEAAWRELAALEEQLENPQAATLAWRAAATMGGKTVTPLLPQPPRQAITDNEEANFQQPDVAGPECIEPGAELETDNSPTEETVDDQLELPVTPAAAYSNESKNS